MTNSSDETPLDESTDNKLRGQKAYVPVSLVICSEIESHDIFRDILIEMFDSIRAPGQDK